MAKDKPFPLQIESADDTKHINAIIYGDTGAGKTHLLGTGLEMFGADGTLVVDTDGGTLTLAGWKDNDGREIQIVKPRSWKEMQQLYDWFYHDNHNFRAIMLDSLTETQKEKSMGQILGEQADDGYYKDLSKLVVADRQDWLKSGNQMRKYIRAFRNLAYLQDVERRVHVIFTALEKVDEKKKLACPDLPGALGLGCGAMVDILARLSVHQDEEGNDRRHLLTVKSKSADGVTYLAKNRGNRLERSIWDPNMQSLIGAWERGNEEAEA